MIEKEIINLLGETLEKTLDELESVKVSTKDRQEIAYLYKELGDALDRTFGTNVGRKNPTKGIQL
ncbi:hypothetical protein NS29R_01385 [Enterobacter hormaechei subsp. xiangfangensis]|uniref:hypothetical protein n=1 Tax=Enterobacter hormaechei TaxID=158836 RepID=UPI0007375A09|nr:hypothetical protein [Enterobacter hormaechei]KTQ62200.1 hypothetical protein NS23R_02390 [Enterobacter hormaechei]KTQ63430.1 hypothetical protein NS28R_04240 [Enterobacter hormaechei subsp. xiangfangensis]KTQ66541.1 hypothetical protein NS34R_01315 [Enterobacter hormaechei]KTQ71001.1 hypothetical protein NS19R_05035 [Enterobacter hormaechei subsp. xiangfangensis]KTQ81395.1 hypothetical protein NS7_08765 [Enterobacter hormaechei]